MSGKKVYENRRVLLSLHATAFQPSFSRVLFWSFKLEVKERGTWRNERGKM